MIPVEQIKAFAEYTLLPISNDIRQILEKAKELNLPISESLIKTISTQLVRAHIAVECIRAVTYLLVAYIVCLACVRILA